MRIPTTRKALEFVAALAVVAATPLANAVPFASGVTNNSGNVSFILNEGADNVKVIFDGGGVGNTNDLGAIGVGTHTFALGGHTSFEIHVTKSTPLAWTKYSTNLVPKYNNYWSPGGLAINQNPADLSRFGRIYVVENQGGDPSGATRGLIGDGIYIVNADFSDALGRDDTASTGGITFESGGANDGLRSPNKIEIGADGYIYVADWSLTRGNVYRFDPDITTGEIVLDGIGATANTNVHTTINGSAIVKGSLAGGNLQVWAIDGGKPNGSPHFNQLFRWDINAGPLPYAGTPVGLATNSVRDVTDVQSDLDIAPDGKFFMTQNRAVTVGGYTNRQSVNIRVFDTDGITELWNSHQQSTNILGGLTNADIFANARAIKVSPDNKKVALIINNTHVWIMDLTNGVPDITTRFDLNAFALTSTSTAHRREVAWDAAGNLYAGNNSSELIVAWSPGGAKTAITGSGGTFQLIQPAAVMTVSNLVTTVAEGSSAGAFQFKRAGDTSQSMLVTYNVTGTAVNGTDCVTLPGAFTLTPGQTTTNIVLSAQDDSEAEFTETVIVTLTGAGGYSLGAPGAATVSILDTDTPEISISGVTTNGAQTNLLEAFVDSRMVFRLTRKGLLANPTTVNLAYSGVAVRGSDYNAPLTLTFGADAVNTNLFLTSLNDSAVESPEALIVTVAPGSYSVGAAAEASGLVYSEDLVPGTVLFADAFDTDTVASWIVNKSPDGDSEAVFGYDYSATSLGIPEAPSSSGAFAAKKGLRLRAHLGSDTTITPGISVSPASGNFTGDHRLRFDMWMNYNGPLPEGGAGSTQHSSYGLGTSGAGTIWPGGVGTADCIFFTASCEGGVGDTSTTQGDYAIYTGPTPALPASGFFAAGTNTNARGNGNPHYGGLGGSTAPASQLSAYPTQTGQVSAGGLGMAWHSVTLAMEGDNITWDIDGYRIATVPISTTLGSLFGNNIFLGFHDWFASTNGNPELQFVLYDNVRVEAAAATPLVITGIQLINGGADVQVTFTASTSATAAEFELHKSATVDGSYAHDASANITGGAGSFQAVTAISPGQQFYRIKKP